MSNFSRHAQLLITIGLLLSGVFVGLASGGVLISPLVTIASVLGWFFGVIALMWYLIALILALYRKQPEVLWNSLIPLNFGLVLLAAALMLEEAAVPMTLAPAVIVGSVSAAMFWRQAAYSKLVLVAVNIVLFAPTLPVLAHVWNEVFLAVGTLFVLTSAFLLAKESKE